VLCLSGGRKQGLGATGRELSSRFWAYPENIALTRQACPLRVALGPWGLSAPSPAIEGKGDIRIQH